LQGSGVKQEAQKTSSKKECWAASAAAQPPDRHSSYAQQDRLSTQHCRITEQQLSRAVKAPMQHVAQSAQSPSQVSQVQSQSSQAHEPPQSHADVAASLPARRANAAGPKAKAANNPKATSNRANTIRGFMDKPFRELNLSKNGHRITIAAALCQSFVARRS
jgi:hypothetical protein